MSTAITPLSYRIHHTMAMRAAYLLCYVVMIATAAVLFTPTPDPPTWALFAGLVLPFAASRFLRRTLRTELHLSQYAAGLFRNGAPLLQVSLSTMTGVEVNPLTNACSVTDTAGHHLTLKRDATRGLAWAPYVLAGVELSHLEIAPDVRALMTTPT